MKRADDGKEIDKNKWTIVCAEQGIGDQVLFLHSMNEAIEELGKNSLHNGKRLYPIIKAKLSKNEVVACSRCDIRLDKILHWKKMDIYRWVAFLEDIEKLLKHIKTKGTFLKANKQLYEKYKTEQNY